METAIYVLAGVAALAVAVMVLGMLRGAGRRAGEAGQAALVLGAAERLASSQAELAGRLAQVQNTLNERMDALTRRVGDGLVEQTERTGETLRILHERLAVIDAAQKNITGLSEQMVGLQDILANKQTRGEFGEIQLNDIVSKILPPSAYAFQVKLGNGRVADCRLDLPIPPGPIVIDSKFPLESYQALRAAGDDGGARLPAARAFAADVTQHIRDIQLRYIVPGETAESALMFLPSEAVYAELHANFRGVIEESYRRRVWIVSPTTLMATLNTVRAVLKDVRMREQAHLIQEEVLRMGEDVSRLDGRVANLQKHFDQVREDVRQIGISTEKIVRRAGRIEEVQLGAVSDGEANPIAPEPEGSGGKSLPGD